MDDGKRKTLVEWVNSLAVHESIECLTQLKDGRHLLSIANLVEGIPQQSDIDCISQRWELIKTNIEGLYQCGMEGRVSLNVITSEGHEFEIAKVTLLLMSAAMLCERNAVFVDRAMHMDVLLQYEIREMVEWVIQPNQNLYDLDPLFHQVLCKPLDLRICDTSDLNPQASSTPQPNSHRSRIGHATPRNNLKSIQEDQAVGTPVFSTSILDRFTSPVPTPFMNSPISPVQQMVQSPHMANKIRLQQKEQKIKLLQRELNAKRHLISEYEAEIEDKRKELDEKDVSLVEVKDRLQQAARRVTQLQNDLEYAQAKEEVNTGTPDASRIAKMRREMTDLRNRNVEVESENEALYTRLHQLQNDVSKLESAREQVKGYESNLRRSHQTIEELREALTVKGREVAELTEATEQAYKQLEAVKTDQRQRIFDLESQLERSGTMPGESLGGVMEIQYKEQLASLESQLNEYQATLEQKASHVLELMTEKEQLTNEKSELSNTNNELLNQVNMYHEKLETTERTLNETIEMSTMWEQKAQLLETNLNDERRSATSRLNEMERSISELKEDNTKKDNQISEAHTSIKEIQAAMVEAQKSFSKQDNVLREQINKSENQIQDLLQKLQEEQEQSTRLKEQVSVKHVLVESLEARACSMEEELNTTQQKMSQCLQEKESQILHLKEELVASEGLLQSSQQNLSSQLAEKQSNVETLETKLASLEEQFCETQRRLNQDLEAKEQSVRSLEEQLIVRSREVEDWKAKMANAEEQLINTQRSLSQELDHRQAELSAASSQLETTKSNLASVEETSHQQSLTVEKLNKDCSHLQEELESLRKQSQSEVRDYQETISQLQDTLRTTTEEAEQVSSELKHRLVEREEMVEKIKQELRNATEQSKALNEEAQKLKKREGELEEQLQREQVAAEERKSEFTKQIEMATMFGTDTAQRLLQEQQGNMEKIRQLKHTVQSVQAEKEKLVKELSEQEGQYEQIQLEQSQQSQETEIELRQVSAQYEALSAKYTDSQNALEAFKGRVREQEMQNRMLEDQLSEAENATQKLKDKVESLNKIQSAAQEEAAALRQELNVECERAEVIENELMETQQEADNKKEGYLQEIAQLRNNIQLLRERSEASSAMYEKVEEHLRESKAEALRIEEQRTRDQRDLENAQHYVNELQEELEEAKFRIETLESSVDDYQNRADTLEARLKEFMDETEGERSTLKIELSDSDSKLLESKKLNKEAQEQIEMLEETCRLYVSELQTKATHVSELILKLEEAQATISRQEEEIKSLKEELEKATEDLKIAHNALFNSEKEKEVTVSMLESSRLSLTGREDHLGALQENMVRLKEELEASNTRCQELQETLTVQEHKASSLAAQLQTVESEAERTQMKLESDLEQAEEDMEALQNNIDLIEKERAEQVNQLKEAHAALQGSKQKTGALEQQMAQLRDEFSAKLASIQKVDAESQGKKDSMQHMMSVAETNHNAICAEYEKKIAAFQQEATAVCKQYEDRIQQLQLSAKQAEASKEAEVGERMSKLQQEHKEELKILGARIESLTNEHQDLKCWEISERTTIKELEEKCTQLEQDLTKSKRETVMADLKVQAAEKKLNNSENEFSEERANLTQELTMAGETIHSLQQEHQELQSKLKAAEASIVTYRTQQAEKEAQVVLLQERVEHVEGQFKELTTAREQVQVENEATQACKLQEQAHFEERCRKMEEELQRSSNEAVASSTLSKKLEEELAQQRDEHFEEVAELEIKYQLQVERLEGETESLQSQINKITSELTHTQEVLAAVERKASAAQNDAHSEIIGLEKEKLQMESAIESFERQLKTARADYGKAMRLQEVKALENVEIQQKARRLEREIHTLMEREKRHLAAHQRETSMGADMNARLQSQLEDKEAELQAVQDKCQKEVEQLTLQLGTIQETYNTQLNDMEERNTKYMDEEMFRWKNKFEQLTDSFNKLEELHAASERERQRLVEEVKEVRSTEGGLGDQLSHIQAELQAVTAERNQLEEKLQERSNLENQLREEEMLNKRLGNQVRSLEAQLEHATRQLKADGQRRSLVPPPPPPHLTDTPGTFRRALQKAKETTFDKNSPKSSPEFARPFDLRSNSSPEGPMSIAECTVTPGTTGRYFSRLSLTGSIGPTPRKSSASSLASSLFDSARSTRSRTARLSISSSTSTDTCRSIPIGTGALFHMEDEPMEFEWGRLSELQRRNTLCLPHMKSSYPAELQTVKPNKISEKDLQKGEPLTLGELDGPETRSQSRKRSSNEMIHSSATGATRRKTVIGATRASTATLNGSSGVSLKVYPHYSPHLGGTPKHKLARSSPANGTPTNSATKKRKSPRGETPKGRKRITPIKKPKTPKNLDENTKTKSKPIKTPMSFSIGFTPKKSKRLSNFIRRKKPVGETPKGTPKSTPKIKASKKPLGDHN